MIFQNFGNFSSIQMYWWNFSKMSCWKILKIFCIAEILIMRKFFFASFWAIFRLPPYSSYATFRIQLHFTKFQTKSLENFDWHQPPSSFKIISKISHSPLKNPPFSPAADSNQFNLKVKRDFNWKFQFLSHNDDPQFITQYSISFNFKREIAEESSLKRRNL